MKYTTVFRQVAGLPITDHYPIDIISGDSEPKLSGRPYHYVTKRGYLVRYPLAYKKAWGKPIYVHSTLSVKVGRNWIRNQALNGVYRYIKLAALDCLNEILV